VGSCPATSSRSWAGPRSLPTNPIRCYETTLNAASTAAAQGTLELAPVIVMGFLGAVVGDSALFWIARRYSHRIKPQIEGARAHRQIRDALAVMDSSAPLLIVGGRYVPGMRFVVNATMGITGMPYRRFLPWSVLSGALWSTYTCVLAYNIRAGAGRLPSRVPGDLRHRHYRRDRRGVHTAASQACCSRDGQPSPPASERRARRIHPSRMIHRRPVDGPVRSSDHAAR
jgi:hypothetical protein